MFNIDEIKEKEYIFKYLEIRNILKQYKKSKTNILNGNYTGNKIGYKQPKKDEIIYFRINKQYRALCRFENSVLIVFSIDNHQN